MLKVKLKDPFNFTETRRCETLSFKPPRGSDAQQVFDLLATMAPLAKDEIPQGLSANVMSFVEKFGAVEGDDEIPMSEVTLNLTARDQLAIASECLEAFT